MLARVAALPVPEPTRVALNHILGGHGTSPTTRLGLPTDTTNVHIRTTALHALQYWRNQLTDPLLEQPTLESFRAAIRSCEAIIASTP
jgi:hypothetical protein